MSNTNKSEPATKADLQELATKAELQKLATKTELRKLATKAELRKLATKAELRKLATKTELRKLATKTELRKLAGRLNSVEATVMNIAIELNKTQADVREIKYDMATKIATKDDISRIMNHIDAFAAEALAYRNHDTLRGGKIMEHETKLSNHETRISELETSPH